jgi:hypothetical protein
LVCGHESPPRFGLRQCAFAQIISSLDRWQSPPISISCRAVNRSPRQPPDEAGGQNEPHDLLLAAQALQFAYELRKDGFGNKILTPLNGVLFMDVVPITAFIVSAISGVLATHVQIIGACVTGSALILNNLYLRYRARRLTSDF